MKLCSQPNIFNFENINLKHSFRWEAPVCLLHKEDITCSISSQRHFVQFLVATTWQYIEHIFFGFILAIPWSYKGHILRISWAYLHIHIHIHILITWSSQVGRNISFFSKKIISSLPTITYFLFLKLSDFPFSFLLLLTTLYKIEEWTIRVKCVFRYSWKNLC